jgi:aspartokinase
MQKNITVQIKNTFNPKSIWTKITSTNSSWIKWININKDQILLHFTDTTMFGAIWYINKITNIFIKYNIIIDSFATSEVSFTCSICKKDISNKLLSSLKKIAQVAIIDNVSKISIVWENMWKTNILQKTFILLENENIHLVSKGASSTNITLFVDKIQSDEILIKLHKAFFE